jgi:predicted RND superfamily exporter protein
VNQRFAAWLYGWRRPLTGLILLGAGVLAPRANITKIDNDLTAWFSRTDPVYQEYQRFQQEFGGTRNLIIALQAPSRARLFSREGFAVLQSVSDEIARVETVERVSSLATATIIDARRATNGDDVLDVRLLTDDLATRTPAEVGARALADDILRGDLVSDDGTVAAVIVFFNEQSIDRVRAHVLDRIDGILAARVPADFRTLTNGSIEISETYNRITLANQARFTPPILVLTLFAIYFLFRSWRRTLLTMCAVLVSVLWTLGLYDLMGFTYNVLSSMILPLIVVLAIADDVHIVQHYDEARRDGSAKDAFISTVSHLAAPLLGASGTTALGMASLATSDVVAVRQFGWGSAVGIMVDFAISLILVPTLLGWLRSETARTPQETWFTAPMRAVARVSIRRPKRVLAWTVAVTALAGAGLAFLHVDTNHINFFSRRHPLSQSAAVIDTKLGGIYTFQVLLEGSPDSLDTPDALQRMNALEGQLRQLPFVRKVTGVVDYVKRAHHELGDGAGAAVPARQETIAQELLVLGLSDQGRTELARVAASDFSKTQITVKLASMSSDLVFEQIHAAEGLAATAFAGTSIRTTVTGSGRLFSTLDHYLVVSQISSFATAFVTVFGVIFLIFRSWRFGLLSVIPNLFPVLAIFGVMGWMNISLNVATIMLASVALGVVDDDTIHFISRYRHETAQGLTTDAAIEVAMVHEGRASLTTALINSCAFGVLAVSDYKPTAWFGGLLALTMVVAFLAEIFILPATIKLMPRLFSAERVHVRVRRRIS